MTNNWAGPVAGRNLGDLGAEVIRIESPGRIGPRASKPTAGQNFRYHYNRSSYNVKLNRNKYGITLDVGQPEGRALFLRLVEGVRRPDREQQPQGHAQPGDRI